MNPKRFLSDFVRVKYPYLSAESQQRARSVLSLSVLLVLLSLATTLALIVESVSEGTTDDIGFIALMLPGIIAVFIVGWLVQTGRLAIAAYTMTGILSLTYLGAFLLGFRADNHIIPLFIVPVLAAGVLLGVRAMIVLALLFAGIGIATLAFQLGTDSFDDPVASRELALNIATSFYPSLVLTIILIYQLIDYISQFVTRYRDVQQAIVGLAKVSQTLNEKRLVSTAYQEIADLMRTELKVDHVLIYRLDSEPPYLSLVAGTGLGGQRLVREGYQVDLDSPSGPAQAYRKKAMVNVNRHVSVPQREAFLPSTNTELAFPLLSSDGQCIGVLDLQLSSNIVPSQGEVELYQAAAHQFALALQRESLGHSLELIQQDVEAVGVTARRYQAEADRMSQQNIGLAWGSYLIQTGRSTAFQWDKGTLKRWRPENPALPQVAQLSNLSTGQRMVVPLEIGGQLLGEIILEAGDDAPVWSNQTVEFVREVVNRLALALENIRLFDEVQRVALREQMISNVAAELQEARNLGRLLNTAAETFNRALGTEQTYVRLGTPDELQVLQVPEVASMD
jgi:GAF domain-containing protein